jgi:hypothetical protein
MVPLWPPYVLRLLSYSLARFSTDFAPAEKPLQWLEASRDHVLRVVEDIIHDRLNVLQRDAFTSYARSDLLYNVLKISLHTFGYDN